MSSVGDDKARDGAAKDAGAEESGLSALTFWVVMAASAVMITLSAAINYRFGHALGVEVGQPMAYAFASLAADGLKILTPILVLALWGRGKFLSLLIGTLGLLCLVWSFAAVLGVAGAALKGAGGPIESLSAALGLDASLVATALPVLLATLIEAAAALGAFVFAFRITMGGDKDPLDFDLAAEADEEEDWTELRAAAPAPQPPRDPVSAPQDGAATDAERQAESRSVTASQRRAGKSGRWSVFRRKPKVRAKGEGTAPPLDEPQPGASKEAEEEQSGRQHHGRALHNRVKARLEEMERKARESRAQSQGGGPTGRKDSA